MLINKIKTYTEVHRGDTEVHREEAAPKSPGGDGIYEICEISGKFFVFPQIALISAD